MNFKLKDIGPQLMTVIAVFIVFGFYTYNAKVNMENSGIDFVYGYSLYDRKDVYDFNVQEGGSTSEDQNFNFVENFRTENSNLGDKLSLIHI